MNFKKIMTFDGTSMREVKDEGRIDQLNNTILDSDMLSFSVKPVGSDRSIPILSVSCGTRAFYANLLYAMRFCLALPESFKVTPDAELSCVFLKLERKEHGQTFYRPVGDAMSRVYAELEDVLALEGVSNPTKEQLNAVCVELELCERSVLFSGRDRTTVSADEMPGLIKNYVASISNETGDQNV